MVFQNLDLTLVKFGMENFCVGLTNIVDYLKRKIDNNANIEI